MRSIFILVVVSLLFVLPAAAQIGGDQGNFDIDSNPSGASVVFDGSYKGTTPVTVAVYTTADPDHTQRHGAPLALAILDLDEFKSINDSYGHAAGDHVLRDYAGQVLSMFRQYDMVARYGGEEFAVLLPNTVLEGARSALRKVQARAAALHCEFDGHSLALPTFSAGLTMYLPGESLGTYIGRADHALYRAKRDGRNRFEVDTADRVVDNATAGGVQPGGSGR